MKIHNFCYKCARDLISFLVDQKYESINENDKHFENRNYDCGSLKCFFRHPGCSNEITEF